MNYKSLELTGDFGVDDQTTPHILSVFNAGEGQSRVYFGNEDGQAQVLQSQEGAVLRVNYEADPQTPARLLYGPFQAP